MKQKVTTLLAIVLVCYCFIVIGGNKDSEGQLETKLQQDSMPINPSHKNVKADTVYIGDIKDGEAVSWVYERPKFGIQSDFSLQRKQADVIVIVFRNVSPTDIKANKHRAKPGSVFLVTDKGYEPIGEIDLSLSNDQIAAEFGIKVKLFPKDSPISLERIQLRVTIDDNLLNSVSPELYVFIYAKAIQGPSMPLAIVKAQIQDFDAGALSVVLDDTMALTPGMRLSMFKYIKVGAIISLQGAVTKRAGDYMSDEVVVNENNSAGVISLLINKLVP